MAEKYWIHQTTHAGHFCLAHKCTFFRNTYVNGYIISTVGGVPADDIELRFNHKAEYMEIGYGRTYETMVFTAMKSGRDCCQYEVADHDELDMAPYNDEASAEAGHIAMCKKYDALAEEMEIVAQDALLRLAGE